MEEAGWSRTVCVCIRACVRAGTDRRLGPTGLGAFAVALCATAALACARVAVAVMLAVALPTGLAHLTEQVRGDWPRRLERVPVALLVFQNLGRQLLRSLPVLLSRRVVRGGGLRHRHDGDLVPRRRRLRAPSPLRCHVKYASNAECEGTPGAGPHAPPASAQTRVAQTRPPCSPLPLRRWAERGNVSGVIGQGQSAAGRSGRGSAIGRGAHLPGRRPTNPW